MRKYIKEIGKHSTVYTFSNFLTRAVGIILIPIYTNYLSKSDYGIISNVVALLNFFGIIFTFGLEPAWSRFFFDYKDRSAEQKSMFGTIFLVLFIFGLLINILLSLFGQPLFELVIPDLHFHPFILLALWTAFAGIFFRLKLDLFRVRRQSLTYGFFSFGRFLLTVTLTIIAIVYLGYGAIGKVASEFICWTLFFCVSLYLLKDDISFKFNRSRLAAALKYGLPTLPHSLSGVLIGLVDRIFLTNLRGLSTVGLYTVGFQFGSIMNLITYSINLSWSPFFMSLAQEKKESAKPIFAKLSTYYAMTVFFLGLLLSFFSKEIVIIFTNKDYYVAAEIIPIFIFSYVINGFYFLFSTTVFYVKKAVKYLPLATVFSALLNIFLNYILITYYGMHGAAWARFISSVIVMVITFSIAQHFYPIRYEYKRLLLLSVITLILLTSYLILHRAFAEYIWQFIMIKAGLLSFYFLLLYITRFLRPEEIKNLRDIYRKHRKMYLGGK